MKIFKKIIENIKDTIKEEIKQEIKETKQKQQTKKQEETPKEQKKDFYKNNKTKQYKKNTEKGIKYEIYIKEIYKKQGYKVYMKGINEGKEDEGIDIICWKKEEVLLIQCKNWKTPIRQKDLRAFIGDCLVYINKNKDKIKDRKIRKLFITSSEENRKNVEKFIKENKEEIEFYNIKQIE